MLKLNVGNGRQVIKLPRSIAIQVTVAERAGYVLSRALVDLEAPFVEFSDDKLSRPAAEVSLSHCAQENSRGGLSYTEVFHKWSPGHGAKIAIPRSQSTNMDEVVRYVKY